MTADSRDDTRARSRSAPVALLELVLPEQPVEVNVVAPYDAVMLNAP